MILNLLNRSMILLERFHFALAGLGGANALDGVVGAGEGRDVRNLVLDGGLADGGFISHSVALCPRRVDDEAHLLVEDEVQNVRAAFGNLVHGFALDASLFVELGGAFRCVDLEAELLENTVSRVQRPRLRGHCRGEGVSGIPCPLR